MLNWPFPKEEVVSNLRPVLQQNEASLSACFNTFLFVVLILTTAPDAVQGALEWLEANQDKSLEEINAESQNKGDDEPPALKPGEEARSLVCNDCGKKFRSHAQAEFHASKTDHVDFSESTEEIAPLTEEEKAAKLAQLREKLAAKRANQAEQDKVEKKRNEVSSVSFTHWFVILMFSVFATQEIRRKNTKETQDIKEELQQKERLKEAAKKKRERQEEIEAKQRIRAKIEADKEARRQKAEKEKAEREGRAAPAPAPAAAAAVAAGSSGPSTPKPASAYTEARLRLQAPTGNIMKTFPAETTLFEVAAAVREEAGIEVTSFTQNFPKKVFNSEYFGESLKDLGFVPSASLIVG